MKGKPDYKAILMVALTASAVFAILDLFAPSVGLATRTGAGLGLGPTHWFWRCATPWWNSRSRNPSHVIDKHLTPHITSYVFMFSCSHVFTFQIENQSGPRFDQLVKSKQCSTTYLRHCPPSIVSQ